MSNSVGSERIFRPFGHSPNAKRACPEPIPALRGGQPFVHGPGWSRPGVGNAERAEESPLFPEFQDRCARRWAFINNAAKLAHRTSIGGLVSTEGTLPGTSLPRLGHDLHAYGIGAWTGCAVDDAPAPCVTGPGTYTPKGQQRRRDRSKSRSAIRQREPCLPPPGGR